jgi:hypothetical protein
MLRMVAASQCVNHDLTNSSFHEAEVSSIKSDTICGRFSIRDAQGFIIAS